ncbi:MAG: HPr family phosphocarrier protein [Clostridiales bacterium]|nr:HPr family phosphocarrier protein [Clostridiales bacterium]
MIEREFIVNNDMGLHARPAAKLTQIASKYKSEVLILKDGKIGNGKSLLSILVLGIFRGAKFTIRIIGEDEIEAMCAIRRLIEGDLNEKKSIM